MDKSFRVHTDIGKDTLLNVPLRQDMDFMEILSLRLRQADAYKFHSSNYGVVVGRVLANDAFGIPNVKVSVFIKVDSNETVENKNIYPYKTVTSTDSNNIRYNLLPDEHNDDCYRIVGTFPNKTEILDEDTKLEIFDKYWKYTTVTNKAGDYMIFGVPVGNQQIHVDLDLSDIGVLSQKPRDMLNKGYDMSQFDSANQFKGSTNLNNLIQIISQDTSVHVYPFWGDLDNDIVGITRSDIQVNYKFEPTCVFMGSMVSDNGTNAIGHECSPQKKNGRNMQLVSGEGTIEMIRKTPDGLVEEYPIEGNRLIDGNGVWCYQIPMNLDYVGTDEYGNICPTEDPSKGIPTRTRVRFRVSKDDTGDEGFSRHTAKILIPNNPTLMPDETIPTVKEGTEIDRSYIYGSATPDEHFRDLYWNRVYSIKSYIPRFQTTNRQNTEYYSAIKSVNVTEDQNVVPFNRLNVKLPFVFVIVCVLFKIIGLIVCALNSLIINQLNNKLLCPKPLNLGFTKLKWPWCFAIPCISFTTGLDDDSGNVTYLPCCDCPDSGGCKEAECAEGQESCTKDNDYKNLTQKVEQKLATSYNIIHLDMYNDWINGTVYLPLWYWRVRKKKTFLFGLFTIARAKNQFCECSKTASYDHINFMNSGDLGLDDEYNYTDGHSGEKYHADAAHRAKVTTHKGVIKRIENKDGLNVYYYASMLPSIANGKTKEYQDFDTLTGQTKVIRAFATDIILLGTLSDFDSDGLPQLFNSLPSTTANVPEIATIKTATNDKNKDDASDEENDNIQREDTGTTVITGMDWERKPTDSFPYYHQGLFMDLSCTEIKTKPKSIINASRLCELNVSSDMTIDMQYSDGTTLQMGEITPDGMVTKAEIETNEGRAMFASMNHLGFLPTNVAEDKLGIKTQVQHPLTSYYVNKFQFIYPTDFDGRMDAEAKAYTKGGVQKTFDYRDDAYMRFRYGHGTYKFYINNGFEDIRTTFFKKNPFGKAKYRLPLFNNSFYFYFGINPGNTALDKFRKIYSAECVKDKKYPFTLDILTRSNASCPEKETDFSFVYVRLDDIQLPYSYTLYSAAGDIIVHEEGIGANYLTIGTVTANKELDLTSTSNGKIYKHFNNGKPDANQYVGELTNGNYTLTITDTNGNTMTERFTLEFQKISLRYQTVDLSKKYYKHFTKHDDICNELEYDGKLVLMDVIIDGVAYKVTNIEEGTIEEYLADSHSFLLTLEGYPKQVQLEIKPLEWEFDDNGEPLAIKIDDCLCQTSHPRIHDVSLPYWDADGNQKFETYPAIHFLVPMKYMYQISQSCDGKTLNKENTTNGTFKINNFQPFNLFLNGMPFKFIIGQKDQEPYSNLDNPDVGTYYNKYFYKTNNCISPTDEALKGWYRVHKENLYAFPTTIKKYEDVWEDFLSLEDNMDMATQICKLRALYYKMQNMFRLSNGVFFTADQDNILSVSSQGGVSPVLIRCLRPKYEKGDDVHNDDTSLFGSMSTATCEENHPNIVGCNYYGAHDWKHHKYSNSSFPWEWHAPTANFPLYNLDYKNHGTGDGEPKNHIGNYFAGFTNNGGVISTNAHSLKVDTNVEAIPVKANPYSGTDISIQDEVNDFGKTKYKDVIIQSQDHNPYLRSYFIDRRLDYDHLVFGADINKIPLTISGGDNDIWQGSRISGTTFNGIEMKYDEKDDYNIIGNVLEYAYTVPSEATGDAKSTWTAGNATRHYYASSINDTDIRTAYDWNGHPCQHKTFIHTNHEDKRPHQSKAYMEDDNNDNYPTLRGLFLHKIPQTNFFKWSTTSCSYQINMELDTSSALPDGTVPQVATAIKGRTTEGETVEYSMVFDKLLTLDNTDISVGDNYNLATQYNDGIFKGKHLKIAWHLNELKCEEHCVLTRLPALFCVWGNSGNNLLKLKQSEIELDNIIIPKYLHCSDGEGNGVWTPGTVNLANPAFANPELILPDGVSYESEYFVKSGIYTKLDKQQLTDDDPSFSQIKFHKEIEKDDLANLKVITIITDKDVRSTADDYLTKHIRVVNTHDFYDVRPIDFSFIGEEFADAGSAYTVTIDTESISYVPQTSSNGNYGTYWASDFGTKSVEVQGSEGSFGIIGIEGKEKGKKLEGTVDNPFYNTGNFIVIKEDDGSTDVPTTSVKDGEDGKQTFENEDTPVTTSQLGHTQYLIFKLKTGEKDMKLQEGSDDRSTGSVVKVKDDFNEAFKVNSNLQFKFVFTVDGRVITVTNPKVTPYELNTKPNDQGEYQRKNYLIIEVQWPSQDGAFDTMQSKEAKVAMYAKASNNFAYKLNFKIKAGDATIYKP